MKHARWVFTFMLICLFTFSSDLFISKTAEGAPAGTVMNYFIDDGGSGTICSQSEPCQLSQALANKDAQPDYSEFNFYFAMGTYTGTGSEVILITKYKVINLFGGWNLAGTGPVVRAPDMYPSVINGEGMRRGITIIQGELDPPLSPTITGISITNGNSSGLAANCHDAGASGCGGGILIDYASPHIFQNRIYSNKASTGAISGQGLGGGIFSYRSQDAQIHNNLIYSNTADETRQGTGGGVYMEGNSEGTDFYNNLVYQNNASIDQTGWGSGLALVFSDSTHVYSSIFYENGLHDSSNSQGSAIYAWYSNSIIEKNLITNNYGNQAVYLGYAGGARFRSNRILDNNINTGLAVNYSYKAGSTCTGTEMVYIYNNFIGGGSDVGMDLRNMASDPICARVYQNTLDDGVVGLYLGGDTDLLFVNNIISNQSTLGVAAVAVTGTFDLHHNLLFNNGADGVAGPGVLTGNPYYINQADRNYHILCDISAAKNVGDGTLGILNDIDDQIRPLMGGYDVGADECTPLFFLPLIKKP